MFPLLNGIGTSIFISLEVIIYPKFSTLNDVKFGLKTICKNPHKKDIKRPESKRIFPLKLLWAKSQAQMSVL